MIRFLAVPAVLLAVLAAAPSAGSATTPAASPGQPPERSLVGVACPRNISCWAVGNQVASRVTRTLIEHWNGRKWSLSASPSVRGSSGTFLSGVSCSGRLNCWAVGDATLRSAKQEPIAEHWNGRKWSLTVLPEPAGLAADSLLGIWCPGPPRCWAVGIAERRLGAARLQPLAEHWNGRNWSVVPAPASGSFSDLLAVFCRRDTNCWAVGVGATGGLAEHWNGRRWSFVATPATRGGLQGVWCPSTDCFAAGTSSGPNPGSAPSTVAERWDGRRWSITPTAPLPNVFLRILQGVSCATSVNCFTVGLVGVHALIEHWQGSKWVRVKSPSPAGEQSAELHGVFCLSPAACWAVGASAKIAFTGPYRTLAEHWNGRRWSIVPSP
jgi:hypothetical protein